MRLYYTLHSPQLQNTVVLLHGMGSCGEDWALQIPALAERYRVVTPDMRGHGQSDKPPGPYSIAHMAGDVIELMNELKIESAHVAGLSMGGCIALQLAIAHANRVRSAVIVNSFAKARPAGWRGVLRFLNRIWSLNFGTMVDVAEPVARSMFPKPEQAELRRIALERIASNPKKQYRAILSAVVRFNALPHLNQIKCPVLIVAGDRDLTVPLPPKRELHRKLPGSEFVLISDSGHATPVDQPEKFNEALLDFIGHN